jgi:hypothetical protein
MRGDYASYLYMFGAEGPVRLNYCVMFYIIRSAGSSTLNGRHMEILTVVTGVPMIAWIYANTLIAYSILDQRQ